jgi:hypothetical protein
MSLMPIIDDRMVGLFRRTGKRRSAYRPVQGGRVVAAAQRVVPQRCRFGDPCVTHRGEDGICDRNGNCIFDITNPSDPWRI